MLATILTFWMQLFIIQLILKLISEEFRLLYTIAFKMSFKILRLLNFFSYFLFSFFIIWLDNLSVIE